MTTKSNKTKKAAPAQDRMAARIIKRAISQTTRDMASWRTAKRQAANVDNPRRTKLVELQMDIFLDPLLTSQVEQRIERSLAEPWRIEIDGEPDDATTQLLMQSPGFQDILYYILETPYWGHSLIELSHTTTQTGDDTMAVALIPRQNVMPEAGRVIYDVTTDRGVDYRTLQEYGRTLIEFGDNDDLGLLNKAIPLALFKRFAERCWSELCEIYGIPPRYLKTDTTDPAMLDRAEAMLSHIGAAAWFIIDTNEEFQFAQGITTNGDVYKNAIDCYNSEMSLLICGAQLGQDTQNGNRSKEEVGVTLLEKKAAADRRVAENIINSKVLPALYLMGFIPPGCRFKFIAEEDDKELWDRTVAVLPYFEVKPEWMREKFGIEVTQPKQPAAATLAIAPPVTTPGTDDFFG